MKDQIDIIIDFIHKTHELLIELDANGSAPTCPVIREDGSIVREVIDPDLSDQMQSLLDLSYQYMNMQGPIEFTALLDEEY